MPNKPNVKNFYPFNFKGEKKIVDNKCVIKTPMGHLCGYVTFDKKDIPKKWWGNYNADALQYLRVHGGITYCHVEGDYVVFGFDCAHSGDDEDVLLKDFAYVMELTEDMETLLTFYAKIVKKWRKCSKGMKIHTIDHINHQAKHIEELGFGAMLDMFAGAKDLGY